MTEHVTAPDADAALRRKALVIRRGRLSQWQRASAPELIVTLVGFWVWWVDWHAHRSASESAIFVVVLAVWTAVALVMNLRALALLVEIESTGLAIIGLLLFALSALAAAGLWVGAH